jgi:release factor glutamine methyltransferase
MNVATFVRGAAQRLRAAGILTPGLDAQVLACDALGHNKAWLLTHGEDELPTDVERALHEQILRRAHREPLAYIRGHQEFYGREFAVDPRVLIPRPETETLIEMIKKYVHSGSLLDVGTGSGAIAVTVKLENPKLKVSASDVSHAALEVARSNAEALHADIDILKSDLLDNVAGEFDAIVANLPYVGHHWDVSPETHAEPKLALYADDDGLALITKLLAQAPKHVKPGGYLLLEADLRQHSAIQKAANEHGWAFVAADGFGLCLAKNATT